MKKIILTAFLVVFSFGAFAQDIPEKKGFITISLGPSFPFGDFASTSFSDPNAGFADAGFHINLINFGYLFSDNVGITAFLSGSAHPYDIDTENDPIWSYGSLMAGPLFSFPTKRKDANFDLRAMIETMSATFYPDDGSGNFDGDGVAFGFGAGLRYHVSRTLSISGNLDIISSEPEFDIYGEHISQQIG
ncbi:MAG: porin family protein, partial [Balneolales bacterium]|nr:porin family protein [Balneolales bacterium]